MSLAIGLIAVIAAYALSEVWPLPGLMHRAFQRITGIDLATAPTAKNQNEGKS